MKIKIIFALDTDNNRVTIIIVGGLCYPFDGFLIDYEIDKRLQDIMYFYIENEDTLLTEEELYDTNIDIQGNTFIDTNITIH